METSSSAPRSHPMVPCKRLHVKMPTRLESLRGLDGGSARASGRRRPGLLRLTAPTTIMTSTLTPVHPPANFSPQSTGSPDISRESRVSYKRCAQSHSKPYATHDSQRADRFPYHEAGLTSLSSSRCPALL